MSNGIAEGGNRDIVIRTGAMPTWTRLEATGRGPRWLTGRVRATQLTVRLQRRKNHESHVGVPAVVSSACLLGSGVHGQDTGRS